MKIILALGTIKRLRLAEARSGARTCDPLRSQTVFRLAVALLVFAAFGLSGTVLAQDAAGRFPEAARVSADYSDPAQAYVALNILWDALHSRSMSQDAVRKRGEYYNTSTAIRQRALFAGVQEAKAFDEKVAKLTMDKSFREGVLTKYGVAQVRADPEPLRPVVVTDEMIKGAVFRSAPVWLGTLVAMYLIIVGMTRGTSKSPTVDSRNAAEDGLPELPESLSVVRVPGLEYTVGVVSAMVLDKESRVQTSVHTTVQQGQVYSMGNQIYSTPGHVSTSTVTTQTDLVWVLTPQKQETSWTFTGGTFRTRPGHLISAITRQTRDGAMQFVAAYNHTTKQYEPLGYGAAHMPTRGRWAWVVSALAGGVGLGIAIGMILSIQPRETHYGPKDAMIWPASLFIEGLIVAAILGLFMVLWSKKKILVRRNAKFQREYLPGFRNFLEERTGAIQKKFEGLGVV